MLIYSVAILFGVGLVAGSVLAISSRVFHVEEDPRIEAVMDALPGANCGGCGYAGCEGYAIAVINDPDIAANLCVAGSAETTIAVGKLSGKAVTEADPLVSVRRCEKHDGDVATRFKYVGLPSCVSAAGMGSGLGVDACPFSCLGLGDCVKVCPFDALELVDSLVRVNMARCTGCGKCINACPRNLLELIPQRAKVMIFCSTLGKAKEVTEVCKVGCISCSLCVKKCPAQAISIKNNVVKIDHQICLAYEEDCGRACVKACKRTILKSLHSVEELIALNEQGIADEKAKAEEKAKLDAEAKKAEAEVTSQEVAKPEEKIEEKVEVKEVVEAKK